MMPTAAQPPDDRPPDPAALMRRSAELLEQYAAAMDALMEAAAAGDGRARAAVNLTIAFRDHTAALGLRAYDEARSAQRAKTGEPESPRRRRAGRHSGNRPLLNVLGGGASAVAVGVAARSARHGAVVKLAMVSTAAGVVAGSGVAYTMQRATDETAVVPPAAASAATPSAAPSSSPPRVVIVRLPRPKGKHHRKPVAAPPVVASVPATAPSPSPSPSPSAVAGELNVQQVSVTLRPSLTDPSVLSASIALTASGGPVSWSADADGLGLDAWGGTLAAGQVQVVTVSVSAADVVTGSSWAVTLTAPGQPDQVVTVRG